MRKFQFTLNQDLHPQTKAVAVCAKRIAPVLTAHLAISCILAKKTPPQ
jgi:hypothetical protein